MRNLTTLCVVGSLCIIGWQPVFGSQHQPESVVHAPPKIVTIQEFTPDCASSVFLDMAYTNFFKKLSWLKVKHLGNALRDQVYYWGAFQDVMLNSFGTLENPPMEIILRNQLCHFLNKRKLRSTHIHDPLLLKWFKRNGKTIIKQLAHQSQLVKQKILKEFRENTENYKQSQGYRAYLNQVKKRVYEEQFRTKSKF